MKAKLFRIRYVNMNSEVEMQSVWKWKENATIPVRLSKSSLAQLKTSLNWQEENAKNKIIACYKLFFLLADLAIIFKIMWTNIWYFILQIYKF